MPKVRVANFSLSLDGFGAGPNQSLENPLGEGGLALHQWFFGTQTFQKMSGHPAVTEKLPAPRPVDEDFAARGFENVGAWIIGRNMFGPIRGPWPNKKWKGWWGNEPPYHCPVFVLTHHARPSLTMAGGTTFHFVTEGIQAALDRAKAAAGDQDVRLGGGVATIRQFMKAGLVDELHVAVSPILLGAGERLFGGLDITGYRCTEYAAGAGVTHVVLTRS
jgi:dihydrofolate reductase